MKRKVIKQANQAYTITLPIKWARENNLEKNQEVEITEEENKLLISTSSKIVSKKIKYDFSEMDTRNISLHLSSAYSKGIDEIEIISDKKINKEITTAVNSLPGYTIISQKENTYLIKDLNFGKYDNLEEIFKRAFQIILSFYESAINDIFGQNKETIEDLVLRDSEINKLCLFLQRSINKKAYPDAIEGRILFSYSYELEQIGDEILRFWKTGMEMNPEKNTAIKKLAQKSYESLAKAFDFYYQLPTKENSQVYDLRQEIREDFLKITTKNIATQKLLRHAIKISEQANDLTQLSIMKKI